jgi:hypothetical protein
VEIELKLKFKHREFSLNERFNSIALKLGENGGA